MPPLFISGLILAAILYVLLPLVGAFGTRRRWRTFRSELYRMRDLPLFDGTGRHQGSEIVLHGRLEGIQGSSRVWIHAAGRSIQVRMDHVRVWRLDSLDEDLRMEKNPGPPQSIRWANIGPLPEGSPVMVCGQLSNRDGVVMIAGHKDHEAFMVLYEGLPETVIPRLVWTGRQPNEFWNQITPLSFMLGFAVLALCIFGVVRESTNRLWAVLLTTLSMGPFAILLPPGIGGFFAYRQLWRKGRRCRARRDMRIYAGKQGEGVRKMIVRARFLEWAALGIFGVSLAVNSVLLFWLLAQLAAVR